MKQCHVTACYFVLLGFARVRQFQFTAYYLAGGAINAIQVRSTAATVILDSTAIVGSILALVLAALRLLRR